jgi:predicted ATPase/DNA-binding winged helix-turn-helix (wHTH) protein
MMQFESFALDIANERLWHEGVQIALAYKPFTVLRYLVENPGRLITHDELLEALWPTTYVQPQVLRTYMQELRKVLSDDAKHPKFIQTLPKRGYSFIAHVSDSSGAPFASEKVSGSLTSNLRAAELVGRDGDLVRLQKLAQLAAQGQRQLVFITGASGIGKTALLNAFREIFIVSSPQARMLCGHCVEGLSEKEDHHPIIEAFDQFSAPEDQERVRRIRAIDGQSRSPIEPEPGRTAAHGSASGATIRNGPGELCEALEELAQQQVLFLILEDIQWAHESTLVLISALARRTRPAKLMVLATFRPHGRSMDLNLKSTKQDLLVRHLCTELSLAPLSMKEIKQFLNQRLHQEKLPDGLEGFIYQRSEGNPLIALALLDHMIAEGFLVRSAAKNEGQWNRGQLIPFTEMEIGVPGELAKRIELEIDRMSPEEQRVLEAGSLMSIAFPVWAVAAVLERDSDYVEELSDNLARRTGLVHRAGHDDLPDGTQSDFYTFTHQFYREALYQRQPTGRRAKGHIRIAERLRELFAGREAHVAKEIAMQYEAAGNWPRTAYALRDAARHAHARHAYQESMQLLEHSLRIAENMSDTERRAIVREIEGELAVVRETISGTSQEQEASLNI